MLANLRLTGVLATVLWTGTGCGMVELVTTPESWGTGAGEYGAKEWVKINGENNYPSAESIAMYCVTVSEDGMKKNSWTFQQQLRSTEACNKAFVEGLSK